MPLLKEMSTVGEYTIRTIIKSNLYTETYRITDAAGNPFFLKLFNLSKLPPQLFDKTTGRVKEIAYSMPLRHRNIAGFVDKGEIELDEAKCQYIVTDFCHGSVLSDYVATNGTLNVKDAVKIYAGILSGLNYLHSRAPQLCHNDLDPSNVIIPELNPLEPVIIDLGHLSERCIGSAWFDTSDIDILYHPNESLVNMFDEQSDIFSATGVLYFMLTGKAPWADGLLAEGTYKERFHALTIYRKRNPLDIKPLGLPAGVAYILENGLKVNAADRFKSIDEITKLLQDDKIFDMQPEEPAETQATGATEIEEEQKPSSSPKHHDFPDQGSKDSSDINDDSPNALNVEIKRGGGNGFADVAGMHELKEFLTSRVINVIRNTELMETYRITPPNGMLLYGPPGCGKTFIAEKFAEETGFNFLLVKSSDLASSFVHGSQEKIGKLFKLAEKNKPIVLCFDEFDAVVPDRSTEGARYTASEVNEFLSQMNNCAKRGIFIVATSNRPDKIDPAVLRTGRIDKTVFVPLPDAEARRELFKLYLDRRPVTDDIDFDKLAEKSDGYIASDIAFIVNDTAMTAAFGRTKISHDMLMEALSTNRPSLRPASIAIYDDIRDKMESNDRRNSTRPRVGFLTNND